MMAPLRFGGAQAKSVASTSRRHRGFSQPSSLELPLLIYTIARRKMKDNPHAKKHRKQNNPILDSESKNRKIAEQIFCKIIHEKR
jgi:hypothetical protein